MARPRPLLELTVAEWLDELARPEPVPGGGSALAFALASAASVLAMAARASESGGLTAQAEALRARTAALAQLDADAYQAALAARGTHEALRADRRDWEIGQAFARAAEPPLEIARAGADVAELAAQLVQVGEPRLRADALAAAALAAAAARGAVTLVSANLTASEGDPRVAEAEQLASAAERAAAFAARC
jgi:formiminotetrahydrofolate cyclodeaminase